MKTDKNLEGNWKIYFFFERAVWPVVQMNRHTFISILLIDCKVKPVNRIDFMLAIIEYLSPILVHTHKMSTLSITMNGIVVRHSLLTIQFRPELQILDTLIITTPTPTTTKVNKNHLCFSFSQSSHNY